MKNKPYTFILNFGYAESGMLSYVPWTSLRSDYKSAKEAFIDLATFFKEHFLKENEVKLKKCCLSFKEKKNDYCGKCGNFLIESDLDGEEYSQFVQDVGTSNNNDVCEFIEYDDEARWQSRGLPSNDDPNVIVVYVAEKTLAAAIGHSPSDKVSIDGIFKKKKGSSIDFWDGCIIN